MRVRSVHQVLVGAGLGDAITSMAITLRGSLRALGPSEIYAHHLHPDVAHEVLPLAKLGRGNRNDLIVYHASYGEPAVTQFLLSRAEKFVLVYHNITPSQFFVEHEPHFAANLHWGRHELTLIRDRVVLATAVSRYNAQDLVAVGYTNVEVLSAGLRPSRLCGVTPSGSLAKQLGTNFPDGFVLSVSQLLPHKRFETILEAMHLVQWVHERPLGLAIVGIPRMAKYQQALQRHAARLRVERVWFFGAATNQELATFYRMSSVYAIASAHEGLALPPLEAMSFGVPVVAREAGALAETIGGAGVLLPTGSGPVLMSEAIAEIDRNGDLRARLRRAGHARVATIEGDDPSERFTTMIAELS